MSQTNDKSQVESPSSASEVHQEEILSYRDWMAALNFITQFIGTSCVGSAISLAFVAIVRFGIDGLALEVERSKSIPEQNLWKDCTSLGPVLGAWIETIQRSLNFDCIGREERNRLVERMCERVMLPLYARFRTSIWTGEHPDWFSSLAKSLYPGNSEQEKQAREIYMRQRSLRWCRA